VCAKQEGLVGACSFVNPQCIDLKDWFNLMEMATIAEKRHEEQCLSFSNLIIREFELDETFQVNVFVPESTTDKFHY
jgi:hypothetical protein